MHKLSDIAIGKVSVVKSIEDPELAQKLLEMGCTPGEKIIVQRKAPFADPIAIVVSGFMLSIRKEDAEKIIVKAI